MNNMNKICKELSNWSIDISGLILKLDPLRNHLDIPNSIRNGYLYDNDEIIDRLLDKNDRLCRVATALRFHLRYMQSEELFWITEFDACDKYPYIYMVDDTHKVLYERHFSNPDFTTKKPKLGKGWTLIAEHTHSNTSPSGHLLKIYVKNGLGRQGSDIIEVTTFPIFLDYNYGRKYFANDYGFDWDNDYGGFYNKTTGCLIQCIDGGTGIPSTLEKRRWVE